MDVSGDESEGDCWCALSVCFLASVLSVPILISPVDMVLDLLSVTDVEVDGPHTFSCSRMRGANALEREQHKRAKAKQAWKAHQSSRCRCPRGRQSKRYRSTSWNRAPPLLGRKPPQAR